MQRKLAERKKEARLEKRARLTSALASKSKAQVSGPFVSRTSQSQVSQVMAEVDQSSRMISQLTQVVDLLLRT